MTHIRAVPVACLLAALPACSTLDFSDRLSGADTSLLPSNRLALVEDLVSKGFSSCPNLLDAAIRHSTGGGRSGSGWGGGYDDLLNVRPVSYTFVDGAGWATRHANVTVGLDGSGKCFADWRVSQAWPVSCDSLVGKASWIREYPEHDRYEDGTSMRKHQDGSLTIFLSPTGPRSCLVNEGEIIYYTGTGMDMDESDEPNASG